MDLHLGEKGDKCIRNLLEQRNLQILISKARL